MKTFSYGTIFAFLLLIAFLAVSCGGGGSSSGGPTTPPPQPAPVAATPTFSPEPGTYPQTQHVTISSATNGTAIYYTTDGSTPTTSSARYTGSITVASTTTIKAITTAIGYSNSPVASATYTIVPPASASYSWKNVEIVAGGFITGIVFHPAQRDLIYARTDIGGAYRWNAVIKRWIPLTDWIGYDDWNYMGIESIGLDPSDPQRLYLAAGTYTQSWAGNGAILVSPDQGRTFTVVPMPFKMGGNENGRYAGERFAVDPNDGRTVYFGSRFDGLWQSTDHGLHWSKVSSFPAVGQVLNGIVFVQFVKSSGTQGSATPVIYAGVSSTTTASVYRSIDAGKTWSSVPGAPRLFPNHGVFGPDGNLYISIENNIGPNGVTDGSIWKYTPEPGNPGGNGTWANITPSNLPYEGWLGTGYNHGWGCVAVDPQRPGVIMASTIYLWYEHDGIVRSTDGGNTWIDLGETSTRDASLSPYLNWGASAPGVGNWIGTLAIDPFNSDHVLYGTGATIWATNEATKSEPGAVNPGFLVLRGGSTNWTVGASGIEETAVIKLLSPPSGPTLISALGDINGFVHDDLTKSPAGGMQQQFFTTTTGIDFAQNAPSVIARVGNKRADSQPYGAYSTDSGKTWTAFASYPAQRDGGTIAVSADGGTFVWSTTEGRVYSTTDNGASWTQAVDTPWYAQVMSDRVNPKKFYLFGSDGHLFISTDGGLTFTGQNSSLPLSSVLSVSYAAEGDLWITSRDGLYHSADSGSSFTAVSMVQESYALGFGKAVDGTSYPTVYMLGKVDDLKAIFRSTDAGASWLRINDDQHQYGRFSVISGDPRIFGRVYLGTNGRGIIYGDPAN